MINTNDIRSALERELAQYEATKENPLKEMLHSSFTGRMRWAAVITWSYLLLFTAIAVYSGSMFFLTDLIGEKILWAAVFLAAFIVISVVKLWYWMIANRNTITREIKRLELQIALLTEKLDDRDAERGA